MKNIDMRADWERAFLTMVDSCAETARSLANRQAMSGIYTPLHILASKGSLTPITEHDAADRDGYLDIGIIPCNVPYSQYWNAIHKMARNAPLF